MVDGSILDPKCMSMVQVCAKSALKGSLSCLSSPCFSKKVLQSGVGIAHWVWSCKGWFCSSGGAPPLDQIPPAPVHAVMDFYQGYLWLPATFRSPPPLSSLLWSSSFVSATGSSLHPNGGSSARRSRLQADLGGVSGAQRSEWVFLGFRRSLKRRESKYSKEESASTWPLLCPNSLHIFLTQVRLWGFCSSSLGTEPLQFFGRCLVWTNTRNKESLNQCLSQRQTVWRSTLSSSCLFCSSSWGVPGAETAPSAAAAVDPLTGPELLTESTWRSIEVQVRQLR